MNDAASGPATVRDGASAGRVRAGLAVFATVCLCAASPPQWLPGLGLLVVPGWMAFHALVTDERARWRKRTAYAIGLVHMLYFSFSVRHILLPAYVGIGVVGGLYYTLAAAWTRRLARFVPGGVAFGCALAGTCWLRASFAEIQYPHVQPIHCLYRWPELLAFLRFGDEIGGNLLLGVLAGGAVDLYRAWRVGRPGFRRSQVVLGCVLLTWGLGLVPPPRRAAASPAENGSNAAVDVRVDLLQPTVRPQDFAPGPRTIWMRERIVEPTIAAAGVAAQDPPDLVVWPESVFLQILEGRGDAPEIRGRLPFRLAPGTRLLQGSLFDEDGEGGARLDKAIALLVDAEGRYCGHQEKRRLVPGGEHAPFLDYLPQAASAWVRARFAEAMHQELPELARGRILPLLETAAGVRFGAMICFDNAFPEVAGEMSRRGAAFLVVLSNESWYEGGAELEQMVAMSVCRAIATRLPILRCTVDGATLVVAPDGRIAQSLPSPASDYERGQKLEVRLRVPPRGMAAVPSLRTAVQWFVLLTLLVLFVPRRGS